MTFVWGNVNRFPSRAGWVVLSGAEAVGGVHGLHSRFRRGQFRVEFPRVGVAPPVSHYYGDTLTVQSGGTAIGTVLNGGSNGGRPPLIPEPFVFVLSGGVASGSVATYSGTVSVGPGGLAVATVLSSGGIQTLAGAGAMASGTILGDAGAVGDYENVSSGGIWTAAIVSSGGVQWVFSGGISLNTLIVGGYEIVSSGGVASGVSVGSGSQETSMDWALPGW